MVKFYVMRIKLEKMTIDEVPQRWRKLVNVQIESTDEEEE